MFDESNAHNFLNKALAIYPRLTSRGCNKDGNAIRLRDIILCAEYLSTLPPTKTPKACSYTLKHIVEVHAGFHISHGALIVAGIGLDIPRKQSRQEMNFAVKEPKDRLIYCKKCRHMQQFIPSYHKEPGPCNCRPLDQLPNP